MRTRAFGLFFKNNYIVKSKKPSMRPIFITLFILSTHITIAQQVSFGFFRHPDNTSRILLFGLPEKDDEWELTNEEITSTIKQYWTATSNYEILLFSEAQAKAKKEKDKYAVAFFVTNQTRQDLKVSHTLKKESDGSYGIELEIAANGLHIEFLCGKSTCFGGYFYTKHYDVSKAELISVLMMAQYFYGHHDKFKSEYKILKESSKLSGSEIKTKTLLIDKTDVGATEEEIRKNYPFAIKLVDKDFITKAILDKSEEYLIIHKGKNEYNNNSVHLILSPSTGAIVSFNYANYAFGMKGLSGKHFKDFISNAGLD
jgi:hypothetical protein